MKKLLKSATAVAFLIVMLGNPVVSQTYASDNANTTSDMDRNDDNGKWGLLGLIGLVGLIGMKKKDRTDTYSSSNTPNNR